MSRVTGMKANDMVMIIGLVLIVGTMFGLHFYQKSECEKDPDYKWIRLDAGEPFKCEMWAND